MPEREISLAQVVLIGVILLAVILSIIFVFIIPNINTVKQSGSLEFACTTYQGEFGCDNNACAINYEESACTAMLKSVEIEVKGAKINLWKTCQDAGINSVKNCHVRCCGILIAARGASCNDDTVKCATGLKCDGATKKCVKE
ncbi:MAG: hypothetical protein HY515_02310 [Candidatus Aenigmarchaeota archaeon]|nr:hypothetical protein [Candidatus Aenigmarchaeota archaeon]